MLDFSWQELLVTAVVALVVIGPKELPGMMRSAGRFVRRAKLVAGEFRQQFDDLADAAELEEIKRKAVADAHAVEPVLSADEASEIAAGTRSATSGAGQGDLPLIAKEEAYTSPDGALTLVVVREDDDVTVSFAGCLWQMDGEALVEEYALVGQSLASGVLAVRRLVEDLKQDRVYIVLTRRDGRLVDAELRLSLPENGNALQDVRVWSGDLPAAVKGDA